MNLTKAIFFIFTILTFVNCNNSTDEITIDKKYWSFDNLGSSFTFKSTSYGQSSFTFNTVKTVAKDTSMNNRTYKKITIIAQYVSGTYYSEEYKAYEDGNYYSTDPSGFNFTYLKNDISEGTMWEQVLTTTDSSGNPIDLTYKFECIEEFSTYTVNNNTFEEAVKIEITIYDNNNIQQDYYLHRIFAKGIGLLEESHYNNGTLYIDNKLLSYQLQ